MRFLTKRQNRSNVNEIESGFLERITMPLVPRRYPRLDASQLIQVQPLPAPAGLVFYWRFAYSQAQAQQEIDKNVNWRAEGF